MIDYSIFYKTALSGDLSWALHESWDVFLSAFNSSERVRSVFQAIRAQEKHWLVCAEYGYEAGELPVGNCFAESAESEEAFINRFFATRVDVNSDKSMCVDTTGFVRPQLLFLLNYLYHSSIPQVDFLYSEPAHYAKKEETVFALGGIREVRQIHGYEGVHSLDISNNLLVIGAGYDSMLIRSVAESKGNSRKMQILGLPSLRADMYQENVLRANKAEESLGNCETIFAPANDPFITADVLKEAVLRSHSLKPITNLYLCPLATKAQVLGFGLFHLGTLAGGPSSVIYPFSEKYHRETTKGIARVWKFTVDFAAMRAGAIILL